MKIKVLVVPTTIILSGFIAVSYIKPGFDEYLQKRDLLAAAKENAAQAEAVAKNVTALNQELSAKKESVDFIKRYFPDNKDEGRMIDSLNFVTGQAGLLTSKIDIEATAEEETGSQTFGTVESVSADPAVPLAEGEGALAISAAAAYQAPKVQRYGVSLEALGGYTNIKDLLTKLIALDRLQELDNFKIGTSAEETASEAEGGDVPPAPNGTLTLSYRSLLPYQALPATLSGESIVGIPGLSEPTFDFSVTDAVKTTATLVPNVVLGTEGKSNPFE